MSKTRMAGDALREKRELARERIAASPEKTAERLSGLDRDAYDFGGYSDKDIVMAMQGGSFGEEDYARLTGKPLDNGGGGGGKNDPSPSPEVPDDSINDPVMGLPEDDEPTPLPPIYGGPGSPAPGKGQNQQVIQNNDINSVVNGDNNTVNNDQDNSVSQSGGSRYLADWMKTHNFFA